MAGRLTKAKIAKLIREAGARRVSTGAIEKMNEVLTDRGMSIAKHAVELAQHSGRETVNGDDIKLAAEK